MSINRTPQQIAALDKAYDTVREHQMRLLREAIWHSCLNCVNFMKGTCLIYKQTPPPEIIVHGCRDWEDDIPF